MRNCLLFLFLFLFAANAFSQNLRGRVIDDSGEPISAASIYIIDTKQGLISNNDGEFQVSLPSGKYRYEVRSVGYESQESEVRINSEDVDLLIVLKSKDFQLAEVKVTQGEDPAYEIIRQTIKKAPYYQSIIKTALYETYSKGSGKFTDIPKLMEKMADEEDKEQFDLYMNKLFLQESLNEMKYTAPDKYEQTVKAYSSSMPFNDDPEKAMAVKLISLYSPMWGSVISPLNPNAFNYYKFRYEGYEEEDGQIINIVRIIPKLKNPKLTEGVLHITDDEWSIRYADYTINTAFVEMRFLMNFHQVVDDIYLVTNYEAKASANIFGLKFYMDFLSSIQYFDIQLNEDIASAESVEKFKKEMRKKEKKSLELKYEEIPPVVDSLALDRDSTYWSQIRSVVLDVEEMQSYQYKDTLRAKADSIDDKKYNPKFSAGNIIGGGTLGSDSSFMYFRFNGLVRGLIKDYNYADGLWMGQSFELDFKKRKNTGLQVKPDIYWTSARKSLVWKVDAAYDYAPLRLGQVFFSAGRTTEDFSGGAGMDRFINMTASWLTGRNYARFYESDWLSLYNKIDIANGLQLTVGGQYAKAREVNNHTTWNLFGIKDKWNINRPNYAGDLNMQFDHRVSAMIHLKYTPEYYYRIEEGKKEYVRSSFPTFEVDYRHGFHPDLISSNSHYNRLEVSISQTIHLDYFKRLNYKLIAGKFFSPNKQQFNYIDYKHFNRGGPWITFKSMNDSYALLPYYQYSTNNKWAQAFINYNTDYLLLKRLPFLQGKMFTETLQVKLLHTPEKKYYSEWGYSVDLPMNMGRVGAFVSFDKADYNSFGLQFSIPMFKKASESRTLSVSF